MNSRLIHGIEVKGVGLDAETRCAHYASERDIIAIKFHCCRTYYPCYRCHRETAAHPASLWPAEASGEKAVLCGACGHELTIRRYTGQAGDNPHCPRCGAGFNPGCRRHYHLYFERS